MPVSFLSQDSGIRFSAAEGEALLYVKTSGGVSNIWRRPLNGGEPKQVTSFTSERITSSAVEPNGKWLALARGKTTSDVALIRDLKCSQMQTDDWPGHLALPDPREAGRGWDGARLIPAEPRRGRNSYRKRP
jgi:Tol biopolymer transport system component